jgi:hypothetical protein
MAIDVLPTPRPWLQAGHGPWPDRSRQNPERLLAAGVDGIVIAAATNAHVQLIRAGVDEVRETRNR